LRTGGTPTAWIAAWAKQIQKDAAAAVGVAVASTPAKRNRRAYGSH
jgi:hypothetical protein